MEYEKILKKAIEKWNEDNELNIPPKTLEMLVFKLSSGQIPFSSKQAKKAAQQYRREARNVFSGYQHQLKDALGSFNKVLKKRPKYIPNWAWRIGASIFIDIKAIEKPLIQKDQNLST